MDHAAIAAGVPALMPACQTGSSPDKGSPVSQLQFRGAMANFATAVSVIATDGFAGMAGLTCSAVCSVSDTPATLAVCVHGKSAANAIIKANGVLSVNCLHADQRDLSQAFAGVGKVPMADRFAMASWTVLTTGAPCCRDALVVLDCEIDEVRDIGTHSVFIVRVVATAEASNLQPLIYQQRDYATTRAL
jgi:flavin reductase (NADH)/flavin reductase/chlorophenol-4-monooxygenase component 1